MGEANRKRTAGLMVMPMADDPGANRLPPASVDVMACQIGERGQPLEQATKAAEWLVRAADKQPGALILLAVAGWDDDPREVIDIPEAAALFRAFGERLMVFGERGATVANRLDRISRSILMVCLGLVPREHLTIKAETLAEELTRLRADYEHAKGVG